MTRLIPLLVAIIISALPAGGLCSYLIQLKNGGQILTNHYWKEKGQIRFYYHGGIIGFYETSVHDIIDSELPIVEARETPEAPPTPKSAAEKKTAPEEVKKALESDAVKKYKKEKDSLRRQYQAAKRRLNRAQQNRDTAAIEKAKRQMQRVVKKMSGLTKKVKSDNNGSIPGWW